MPSSLLTSRLHALDLRPPEPLPSFGRWNGTDITPESALSIVPNHGRSPVSTSSEFRRHNLLELPPPSRPRTHVVYAVLQHRRQRTQNPVAGISRAYDPVSPYAATLSCETVVRVRSEVDKLSAKVCDLEKSMLALRKVADKELFVLMELLMVQLLKLDGIEANGEARAEEGRGVVSGNTMLLLFLEPD